MGRLEKLTLHIVGPLRLIDRDGCDRTPKGRKAGGLLALLAVAPENRRSRQWLQDKLWSDRAQQQGSDSLRQTLAEIRRALGPDRNCILSDRVTIALDRACVQIEKMPRRPADGSETFLDECILFEGLDIRDAEFEDWLRDQRLHFETELERSSREGTVNGSATIELVDHPPSPERFQLILEQPREVQSLQDVIFANTLTDIIAKTIAEITTIDILDRRNGAIEQRQDPRKSLNHLTLAVQTDVASGDMGATWRVQLSEAINNRIIWATTARQRTAAFDIDAPNLLGQLNQVVGAAINGFMSACSGQKESEIASFLCHQGIRHLFKLGKQNFVIADQLFQRAFEMEPRGIYLAWRAYLRTYLLAERQFTCRQTLIEEALALMYKSLELEPLNSYVASFSAHVHTIMRRSYVAAYEQALHSIQINRANPLAWACLGIAECHLGKTKAGFEHALIAREIAGATPFRFQIEGLGCIASCIVGDVDQAIWCGEASHALAPTFAPPLRYLSALYLVRGQQTSSLEAVGKLQAIEPDFSYDILRDKSYPAAGLHRSKFLNSLPIREV